MLKPHAYLFSDGSSSKGDDIGAWASVAVTLTARRLLYGIMFPTTISRCELMPIISGLSWIKKTWAKSLDYRVVVTSDSEYTIKTLSGMYARNKNEDLWAAVDAAAKGMDITYVWRERNTLPYMEICDAVCGSLRRMMINQATATWGPDPRAPESILPYSTLPDELASDS